MKHKLSLILLLQVLFSLQSVAQCVLGPNDFDQASFDVAENTSIIIDAGGKPCIAYKDGGNSGKATVRRYNGFKWETLGSTGFTPGAANATKLSKAPNGDLYILYSDATNADRATVMKYNGSSWTIVGNAGFSPSAIDNTAIAIDASGTPYVALSLVNSSILSIMKFNGTTWATVGTFPYSVYYGVSIALDLNGNPYVAYRDYSTFKVAVAAYNGSSWNIVGGPSLTTNSSVDPTILFHSNGQPYVSFRELTNNPCSSVMKFNGTSWVYVGAPLFYSGVSSLMMILDASGTPYVLFNDATYGAYGQNTAMKFNGTTWVNVSPNGSAGRYNTALVADASGTLYTSCIGMGSGTQKTEVKKFNGTAWVKVGITGITDEDATEPDLALDANDTPYIVFGDMTKSGKATVMKYNGTSWSNVGLAGFTSTAFNIYSGGLSIKVDPMGTPYVMYQDNVNYFKATVLRYFGGSWQTIGPGITPNHAAGACMAINATGEVFVAYVDVLNTSQCTVLKYNGSSWTVVGVANFSPTSGNISIAVDNTGNPYIAISDQTLSGKCTVMRYNGTSWVTVGNAGFSSVGINYLSLAIDGNNIPHVAFIDNAIGKVSVMKYNGISWINEGSNFSSGGVAGVKLVADGNNNLYVSYKDPGSNNKATLMKYNGVLWNPVGAVGFSAGFANQTSLAVTSTGIPIVAIDNGGTFVYKFDQVVSVSSNTIMCGGNTINLSASGSGTYAWTGPNGFTSSMQNPVISNATVNHSGNYHLIATNGSCLSNKLVNVSIQTQPLVVLNNTLAICQGAPATLSVSGTATAYSWSTGATTPSVNVTPSSTTLYTLTATGSNSCSVTNTIQVTVNPIPTLTVSSGMNICTGSSTPLVVSGAGTYSWTTGAITASISVSPTVTTSYSVTGTINNCSSTQTLAVTVNQACQDVWPGDANSDGVADNFDVLELGLHFTQTGPARATTSNAWQSYFANNWTGTISNGKNVNHSDCNGDGTINNNDTLAIFNNYALTHAFKPTEQTVVSPQLSIVPDQNAVAKGSWGTSSVFLGEASAPVTNINGLAFTVTFDQNLIDANSFYIEYPVSFLNTGNQNLKFSKPDFANGKLYTATTHTITNNVSGNGKIAVLHYKVKSNLATDEVLNIGITQAKQSNAAGTLAPLTAGAATIAAIGASVGMDKLSNGNSIGLYPNPANSTVTIQSNTKLEKVELLSITGQIMLSEKGSGTHYQLDLANIASGVYMVHIYSADQKVTRKKLVVQR